MRLHSTIYCFDGPFAGLFHETLGAHVSREVVHGHEYEAAGETIYGVPAYRYVGLAQWHIERKPTLTRRARYRDALAE